MTKAYIDLDQKLKLVISREGEIITLDLKKISIKLQGFTMTYPTKKLTKKAFRKHKKS